MIRIAVEAMGPDAGPAPVVEGAALVSREDLPVHVVLVGDRDVLRPRLAALAHDPARVSIVPAASHVAHDEKPGDALDARPDCSVLVAAGLVARGEADALVSAGNTGALILAAARSLERIPGVRRAALAAVYPTRERHGPLGDPFALMLDVGATLHATADDLRDFAVMGAAYSQVVSSNPAPSVALLSNGAEATKGTAEIVAAHGLLAELAGERGLRFAGNVEGLDIVRGTVDVVVCEGFLGNVVLKMLEGVSEVVVDVARHAAAERLVYKLGLLLLSRGIRRVRELTDWRQYGGAPVLGFRQAVIKAHGRSNAWAIRNAIRVARKTVERDLGGTIARLRMQETP